MAFLSSGEKKPFGWKNLWSGIVVDTISKKDRLAFAVLDSG
jgi:hypothetical protein